MKKSLIALVAGLMLLTACQTKQAPTVAESSAEVTSESSTEESVSELEESSGVPTEEYPAQTTDEKKIVGILLDGTMNTVTITTDDGNELSFMKEDVPVNSIDGLIIGDKLEIYYIGEITDTDTSACKVTHIEELAK